MNPDDFDHFAAVLRASSGIEIGPEKAYLLESRLKSIAVTAGLTSVAELLADIRVRRDPKLLSSAVDAMTTNETYFFRDDGPFEELRNLLPELARMRLGAPLRIWSAACSTGQEVYSLAMLVEEEAARTPSLKVEIVASDLSERVLAKAREGRYSHFEVQRGLSIQRLARHFDQDDLGWRVKPVLQRHVVWRQENLLNSFVHLGMFDLILCRNVLIYFSRETRTDILERLADRLKDGGRLFLGAAETPLGLTSRLVPANGRTGAGFQVAPARQAELPSRASA